MHIDGVKTLNKKAVRKRLQIVNLKTNSTSTKNNSALKPEFNIKLVSFIINRWLEIYYCKEDIIDRENKGLTKLEKTEMDEDAGWRAGMATNCLALLQ